MVCATARHNPNHGRSTALVFGVALPWCLISFLLGHKACPFERSENEAFFQAASPTVMPIAILRREFAMPNLHERAITEGSTRPFYTCLAAPYARTDRGLSAWFELGAKNVNCAVDESESYL